MLAHMFISKKPSFEFLLRPRWHYASATAVVVEEMSVYIPATSALTVVAWARVPDRLVRHIGGCFAVLSDAIRER